ncbi:hypothetical protein EG328_003236 [Venturia inaequalis]|uniref:Uncharacterized protein n=1 Tax=Venturia inaequalis TaxID=5025 RepID=A0A8H3UU27_VENIN|nr:hypothetical protein EG328_003236 [Venturia inaequalis]KAE9993545.1 hypothetical protein EG327_004556 [Venturia inaequalis]
MSGVPATGFIPVAMPLITSLIKNYTEGIRTINRWRKYDRELKSLCRRLRSEKELFRNTYELLHRDIVSSEQELETLVSNDTELEWSNPDLESQASDKAVDEIPHRLPGWRRGCARHYQCYQRKNGHYNTLEGLINQRSLSLTSRGSRTNAGKAIRDEKYIAFSVIISHHHHHACQEPPG